MKMKVYRSLQGNDMTPVRNSKNQTDNQILLKVFPQTFTVLNKQQIYNMSTFIESIQQLKKQHLFSCWLISGSMCLLGNLAEHTNNNCMFSQFTVLSDFRLLQPFKICINGFLSKQSCFIWRLAQADQNSFDQKCVEKNVLQLIPLGNVKIAIKICTDNKY